jgi:hypothetical protein
LSLAERRLFGRLGRTRNDENAEGFQRPRQAELNACYTTVSSPATGDANCVRSGPASRIERHSLLARLFHWVMAAAMFVLLFTAFLPVVGVQFAWVTWQSASSDARVAEFAARCDAIEEAYEFMLAYAA